MSGTSMDGIDAALIETDGEDVVRARDFLSVPYDAAMRDRLRGAMAAALVLKAPQPHDGIDDVARRLTVAHAEAVQALLQRNDLTGAALDVIGFHGQTVAHRPEAGWTWQIGDGALLAQLCGARVVNDFRSADVAAGGQGAPFAPAYHRALAAGLDKPVAVLNLGGVGNITWIGTGGTMLAFDTGPGNALIDDWMEKRVGRRCDEGGATAAAGEVHDGVLAAMLDLTWFDVPPPKSLDRHDFSLNAVRGLGLADGAATLTAFTAETVRLAMEHVPTPPLRLLVTGGGRHNATLMRMLGERVGVRVDPVEAVGWRGDALEAEAFAYLAVRSLRRLPLSYPGTTGVPQPMSGGRVHG